MRRIFLLVSFLFIGFSVLAQLDDVTEFNKNRLQKQKVSMLILGGWAAGNIATGLSFYGRYDDSRRYFHLMNAGWNAVNLTLATVGYLSAVNTDPAGFTLFETIRQKHSMEKILLFNAGLDVGYILGGVYLKERSKNTAKNPDRLKGFGQSIVLQGAFLFAFDLVAYFVQASDNDALKQMLESFHFYGNQLGVILNF